MTARGRDISCGTALVILSVAVCYGAARLHVGSIHAPGAGFFAFLLGVLIALLSLLMIVNAALEHGNGHASSTRWAGPGRKKVLSLLVALVLYGVLLERVGYTLTTFGLFLFLLGGVYPQKWYVVLGGALGASLGSYALFQLALGVQLPRGPLGF